MKMNNQSKMIITRVVKQQIMEDGSIKRFIRTREENEPINLGSLKVPKNKDVIKIEWQIPKKRTRTDNILDGLFG